jgi:hypothetical protein
MPDVHPARDAGDKFLIMAKLRWSDAIWGPNGRTLYQGRHHHFGGSPLAERRRLYSTMKKVFETQCLANMACAMIEVLAIADQAGEADSVIPTYDEFITTLRESDYHAAAVLESYRRTWFAGPAEAIAPRVSFA